jgi:hypothetical protein
MALTKLSNRQIVVGQVVVLITTQRQMVELEHQDKDIGEGIATLALMAPAAAGLVDRGPTMAIRVGLVYLPVFLALL